MTGIPVEVAEGVVHRFLLSAAAVAGGHALEYHRGGGIALHVKVLGEARQVLANDRPATAWGAEQRAPLVALGPAGEAVLDLRFAPDGVRVEAGGEALILFERAAALRGPVEVLLPESIEWLAVVEPPTAEPGVVDFLAPALGGVLVGGWVRGEGGPLPASLRGAFGGGEADGSPGMFLWHPRDDLNGEGTGFLAFLPPAEGEFFSLRIGFPEGRTVQATPMARLRPAREEAGIAVARRLAASGGQGGAAEGGALRALLERPTGGGPDTLEPLGLPVHLGLDWQVPCGPGAAVVMGWVVDPYGLIVSLRLRDASGSLSAPLDGTWVRVPRPDILEAYGARHGLETDALGFLAYGAVEGGAGPVPSLEIALADGRTATKPLPSPAGAGLAAIRRVLGAVTPSEDGLAAAFDAVLGPAVTAINRARLARPVRVDAMTFGDVPDAPRCSVVVPLHGRLDFVEAQIALFSEGGVEEDELLYVLDEPSRRAEMLGLARSAHARFGVPFRLLMPDANLGFGPASNLGLRAARGRHVAFMNSDVFPAGTDWLDLLCADLDADPGLGAVGALLLFGDGSVQHDSMALRPLPDRAGWRFPLHPGKGLVPADGPALREVEAVTGALIVLPRGLALDLGGFDERYVLGDFEDADLCARVRARGLRIALDRRAALHHLERKSQGSMAAAWRHNLTLVNAWLYNRTWPDAA